MREKLIELLKLVPPVNNNREFGENFRNCVLEKFADYLIDEGVTIQKWIPVSEQPKEKGCYLVTVKHWLDGKPVTREAFWNSADWFSCEKRQEITPRVTHWMPLPEPPKEG